MTDYLEGALDRRHRRRFEAHVAECDGCEAYLDADPRHGRDERQPARRSRCPSSRRAALFRSWLRRPRVIRPAGDATSGRVAAADRGHHLHLRALVDRRVEVGALLVDVHVDVHPQRRARLAQAVAQAGPAVVELVDRLVDGARVDLDDAREVAVERDQRSREAQLAHQSSTATSTDQMFGR